jgi:hypothetical protein
MNYLPVEECLQAVFEHQLPLSRAQASRISRLCIGVLLAGEVPLTHIARFLKSPSHQDSRVKWMARLLEAPFLSQEHLYHPLLKSALAGLNESCWHLVIDRTALWKPGQVDLATIVLNYHKRAIPLVWCCVPFGGAADTTYIALIERCLALIPTNVQVILHGDTEFGGAGIIRTLRQHHWDFMLAQKRNVVFRRQPNSPAESLGDLPITHHRSCSVANVELFARDRLGGINILAFYQPHYTQSGKRKREICYLTTSLPLTEGLRRMGRRRWGTEPFYRDFKSAGWEVPASRLEHVQRREGLLIILAMVYLWAVTIGRWLCKTGRRHQVDSQPCRHLSLFRLGWDWLIHQLRCDQPCPTHFTLYS